MKFDRRRVALPVSLGLAILAGLAWLAQAAEKSKPAKGADDAATEVKLLKSRLADLEKRVDALENRQSAFMGLHVDEDGQVKDSRGRKVGDKDIRYKTDN